MFSCIRDKERTFRNLVNGDWIGSTSNNFIDIYSPIDFSLVGRVPAMDKDEVDKAIKSARDSQKNWSKVELNKRTEILYKAASILEERKDELTVIMMKEIAKDRKSCISEILRTSDYIRFTADIAKGVEGESIASDSFPNAKKDKISVVSREALGVVLAISPFNYPINLSASKIAPALVAGNSVVLKPATQGSLCALYLAKVFEQAGVPAGVLNTVTGRGSEIGDYIVTNPEINFINFTGSTEVGKRISQITSMVPLLMELGGKDAAIVLKDADLDLAASNIVSGAYSYSGQRCTAVKRILVVEEIADTLIEKIKNKIIKLRCGNPIESDVDIVPLIDTESVDFVWELINDARAKGAKLIIGGKKEGNLIYPTLFDRVTLDMRLAWEEPFGPVLPVIRVRDKEEAIEIANKSEYGLQSSVFTENINEAFYIANRLEVGTVQVNNKTERGPDNFPFSGVKASGIGTQGIRYSIEAMTRLKSVVININK